MEKPNCRFYEFGDFRLDLEERVLLKDKEEIPLTGKVFDLLLYLVQNEGRTLEHDEILEAVWPDSFVEQANLKKGVSTLRKLLGEQPDESRYIKTVPRRGYRFVAEVKPVLEEEKFVVVAARRQYEEIIEEEIIEDYNETDEARLVETSISQNNFHGRASLPAANTQIIDVVNTKKNSKVYLFAAATCFIVLLLSAALVYRFAIASKPKPPSIETLTLSKLSNTGDVLFSHVTPDGQAVIYGTMDEKGDRVLWVRRVGNKASVIQLMPPQPVYFWGWSISPDGEYVYYVTAKRDAIYGTLYRIPLFGGKPEMVIDFVNGCGGVSPDGQRILVLRWKNDPSLVELLSVNAKDGGDEKLIGTKPNAPNFIVPQWSHDGKRVVYISNDTHSDRGGWSIIEKTLEGGAERSIISSRKGRIWGIALSKSDDGFIMNAVDPETNLAQLYYVSYTNGEEHRLTNDLGFYFGVSASDDGKTISAAQRHYENNIWVITDGKADEAKKITRESNLEGFIGWTPDDRIIYAASENNRLHVWTVDGDGSNPQQLTPNDSIDRDPAASPDGRFIVFLSRRTGAYRLWRADMDGRNPKILFDGAEEIVSPQVTSDGKHILFAISNVGKYVLAEIPSEGGEIKRLTNGTMGMFSLSPDGKQIAYAKYNEQTKKFQIEVMPYKSEGETKTFDISPRDVLAWTPDGKNLLFKYVDTKQFDPATIWQQPVGGGAPKPFMKLKQEYIIDMAFSKDGKKLAVVGSRLITDSVLLQQK